MATALVLPKKGLDIEGTLNVGVNLAVVGDLSVGDDLTVGDELSVLNLGTTGGMVAGTGITTGVGTVYTPLVYRDSPTTIKTEIFVDLTGLNSSAAGDIIGKQATANSHFGRITTAVNGLIYRTIVSCIETPAGGEPDIDLLGGVEATGTEDAVAASVLDEVVVLAAGVDWVAGNSLFGTAAPRPNDYLYLVGSGGGTDDTYTAGQFMIQFWGYG